MASPKTPMDLWQPAKRLKLSSLSDPSKPFHSIANPLSQPESSSSLTLTGHQKSLIEFNRLRAKSKQNLNICSRLVSNSKTQGVGYVKLEELLVENTWLEALQGELRKPYAKNLCKFVENEISNGSVPIYPPQDLIFNALNTTPLDNVKAVIIGQDPYHGPGQAMGLSFSVPIGVKQPSSLVNIFKELHQDLGCSIPSHGNLERWAIQNKEGLCASINSQLNFSSQECQTWTRLFKLFGIITPDKRGLDMSLKKSKLEHKEMEKVCDSDYSLAGFLWYSMSGQYLDCKNTTDEVLLTFLGVLLLNAVLTVRSHQANSHANKGWEQFTDAVIKTISQKKKGVVFLLWGNFAQKKSRLINESKHHILKAAHPSGLSASRGFFGCRHFSITNQLLEKQGVTPIDWQL